MSLALSLCLGVSWGLVAVPSAAVGPAESTVVRTTSTSAPEPYSGYDITYAVAGAQAGGPVATGTATLFRNGTAVKTVALSGGSVTFSIYWEGGLAPGANELRADYAGDANYLPSSSAVFVQDVRRLGSVVERYEPVDYGCPPGSDTVYCIPTGPVDGQPFWVAARVLRNDQIGLGPNPAGPVQVFVDGGLVGLPVIGFDNRAEQKLTLSGGTHTVTFRYPGDAFHTGSETTFTLGVAPAGYVMLTDAGVLYGFGAAKSDSQVVAPGSFAVDVEVMPSRKGRWVLSNAGAVSARGLAPNHGSIARGALLAGETATSLSSTSSGKGYWIFTSKGRVFRFGDAMNYGDMAGVPLNAPVLDSVAAPNGMGYYMVAADGGIFAFGSARFRGSMGGLPLNSPVQSLVPDPDGAGYWLVASDGGVFAFEAPFRGALGHMRLNKPVSGMVAWGDGYLMVGEDGGIFSFSSRPFLGSLGSNPPDRAVVAVAIQDGI